MATIFVAYGGPAGREAVLAFAAERAAASGDDLYVYHALASVDAEDEPVRREIEDVLAETAPEVSYEIRIEARPGDSDRANVSTQKQLIDAVVDADREFAYVVMGDIHHGPIESISIPSMTEAILETRKVPVVLVPVDE